LAEVQLARCTATLLALLAVTWPLSGWCRWKCALRSDQYLLHA